MTPEALERQVARVAEQRYTILERVIAPAGSVMVFVDQLWHGGSADRTAERRWAVACYGCAGWVRQQENQQPGLPRATAARLPQRLQELCGWSVCKRQWGPRGRLGPDHAPRRPAPSADGVGGRGDLVAARRGR